MEVTEAGILNVKKNCRDDLILSSQLLICIDIIQYLGFGKVRSSCYSNAISISPTSISDQIEFSDVYV